MGSQTPSQRSLQIPRVFLVTVVPYSSSCWPGSPSHSTSGAALSSQVHAGQVLSLISLKKQDTKGCGGFGSGLAEMVFVCVCTCGLGEMSWLQNRYSNTLNRPPRSALESPSVTPPLGLPSWLPFLMCSSKPPREPRSQDFPGTAPLVARVGRGQGETEGQSLGKFVRSQSALKMSPPFFFNSNVNNIFYLTPNNQSIISPCIMC